jgi:hypothetical protein
MVASSLHALAYVGLVLASTLFGSDMERLMAPASIVIYLLVATMFDHELECRSWTVTLLIAAAVAVGTVWAISARVAALNIDRTAGSEPRVRREELSMLPVR